MVEPTGYTALDLIGFTDRGPYDPDANYVRNDLVHVGNSTWRCKIDDTTGITPTEGANWTIFIESATSLAGMSDVDLNTPKAGDGLVYDGNDWTNIPIMTKELEIKTGAHNLLRFPTLSELKALNTAGTWSDNVYTFGNATFTVNESAETVTVNCDGTGNAGLYLSLFNRLSKRYYLPNGTYKINGLDNGEDSASYFAIEVSATTKNSTSQAWYVRGINTDGASFTYDDTQIDGLGVTISIMGNHTANNVVVKPMIRFASDTDTSHALYAKTNRELTEDVNPVRCTVANFPTTTGSSYYLHKLGKLGVLVMVAALSNITADTWTLIGTIEEKARPANAYFFPCVVAGTNNALQGLIETDGSVKISSHTGGTINVRGSITYIIA